MLVFDAHGAHVPNYLQCGHSSLETMKCSAGFFANFPSKYKSSFSYETWTALEIKKDMKCRTLNR